jgi:hypothetical protein
MRAIIRKLLALIVFAAAVLLLLNSVAAVLLTIGKVGRIWFVGWVIYSVLSAGGFFLGLFLYAMSRRLNLPIFASLADVEEAARRKRQPIILFLREFASDATHNEHDRREFRDYFITEEERIAKAGRAFGFVAAIGRPGERLPPGGAARLYVSDDQWKDAVGRLIDIAQVIVLRLGATAGVSWEIEEIIARRKIGRTIFVPWRINNEHSVQAFARVLARVDPFPDYYDAVPWMRTFMEEQKASRALSFVTALLLLDGQRRVPFFDQTHDSVRSAVKLLGLAERPNRLLNATKLVAFSALFSPMVVWLVWGGLRGGGPQSMYECSRSDYSARAIRLDRIDGARRRPLQFVYYLRRQPLRQHFVHATLKDVELALNVTEDQAGPGHPQRLRLAIA